MGLVIISPPRAPLFSSPPSPFSSLLSVSSLSLRRRCYRLLPLRRRRPIGISAFRFGNCAAKCSIINADVDLDHVATVDEIPKECPSLQPDCSLPFVHLTSDVLDSQSLSLLKEASCVTSIFTELPVLSEEEQDTLAATPAHPAGLYALYASFLVGNLVEQLWNFAWPAAVAVLHPSLLPVAVLGFFTKLSIFIGAPVIGNLMDHFPRVPAYNSLNFVQTVAQLLSVAMIIHALSTTRSTSASAVLRQPWFIVLMIAGALERVTGLALGVTMERDWVVLQVQIDQLH